MRRKAKSPMKFIVLATLAIVIVGIAIFAIVNQNNKNNNDGTQYAEPPSIDNQPILGDPNAIVSVVKFGDYRCPGCKWWHEMIFPQLQKEYIDTGKVQFAFINTVFLGEESALAALASESVWNHHPDVFWDFHKQIFKEQPQSQQHGEQWLTPKTLVEIAESVQGEIDLEQLEDDVVNETYIDDVTYDQSLVKKYEVSETPSIMINETKVDDPFDYEHIVEIIERELAENGNK